MATAAETLRGDPGEKKLGQLRPFISLYSHRNAWASWHLLGQPNTFLAPAAAAFARQLLVALAAEAECRWVVWGLLQRQLSSVAFDFDDYASQRWACFGLYKDWATDPTAWARSYLM